MSEEKVKGEGPLDLRTNLDNKRAEKQEELEQRFENDIKALMKIAAFRRFVYRILNFSRISDFTFTPETNQTFFDIGVKSVGHFIQNLILKYCPDEFIQMFKEAKAQKIQDEKELNKPQEV